MKNINVKRSCPMCGKDHTLLLTEAEYACYTLNLMGIGLIQDVLPALTPFDREFLKTGYCLDCQCRLFSRKRPAGKRFNKPDDAEIEAEEADIGPVDYTSVVFGWFYGFGAAMVIEDDTVITVRDTNMDNINGERLYEMMTDALFMEEAKMVCEGAPLEHFYQQIEGSGTADTREHFASSELEHRDAILSCIDMIISKAEDDQSYE